MSSNNLDIYYDGDCPFCNNYVRFMNLKKHHDGKVSLFNAREYPEKVKEFEAKGYPLHDGMIVEMDGDVYYGADAVWVMTMLSTKNGFLSKVNRFLFRSKNVSRALYPFLKFGRAVTLKILGKKPL